MTAAVCYYSRHHGNTLKILEAMARGPGPALDLIDVTVRQEADLSGYDLIGFASGVYYGKYHASVLDFARRCLPEGKAVFFACTRGNPGKSAAGELSALASQRSCHVLGEFSCRGFDTFGPFRLIGGISRGHPNQAESDEAAKFFADLCEGLEQGR